MKKLLTILVLISIVTTLNVRLVYADLTTSLVSYWNLDESSGNADDAVASNNLTNNNTVTYGAAKINNGATFVSASSQSLSISDAGQTGLDITGSLTQCYWIKTPTGSNGISVNKWKDSSAGNGSWEIRYDNSGNALGFYINDAAVDILADSYTIDDDTWYFSCQVFDASGQTMKNYMNAVAVSAGISTTATSIQNGNASFRIAANGNGSDTPSNFLDATVDEVGVWSRALSGAEITTLYNAGAGCAYPFTTCAGTSVVRQSIFSDE